MIIHLWEGEGSSAQWQPLSVSCVWSSWSLKPGFAGHPDAFLAMREKRAVGSPSGCPRRHKAPSYWIDVVVVSKPRRTSPCAPHDCVPCSHEHAGQSSQTVPDRMSPCWFKWRRCQQIGHRFQRIPESPILETVCACARRTIIVDGPDNWSRALVGESVVDKFVPLDWSDADTIFDRALATLEGVRKV